MTLKIFVFGVLQSLLLLLFFFQDYELQLVAYKAQVEPLTSPLKKTKMDSASDNIIQEVGNAHRSVHSNLYICISGLLMFA